MDDADSERLAELLGMTTCLTPKLYRSPVGPGVVRLDFDSGLFLERGDGDDAWRLVARTWGSPSERAVHDWQVAAAVAAQALDPSVEAPARPAAAEPPAPPHRHRGRRRVVRL